MTETSSPQDDALIDALWQLVAERGWNGFGLQELAQRAGITLEALRERAASKFDLLRLHARAVDKAVLRDAELNNTGTARDRIFDTLMRRIDALQPHRAGLIRFGQEMRYNPVLGLAMAPVVAASMAWMLEAAQVSACGPAGLLRVQGLSAVWVSTLRAWEQDESLDLGATMAALDRALDKADRVARMLRLDGGMAPEDSMPQGGPETPLDPSAPDVVT